MKHMEVRKMSISADAAAEARTQKTPLRCELADEMPLRGDATMHSRCNLNWNRNITASVRGQ